MLRRCFGFVEQSEQRRDIDPMLDQCCANNGPTLGLCLVFAVVLVLLSSPDQLIISIISVVGALSCGMVKNITLHHSKIYTWQLKGFTSRIYSHFMFFVLVARREWCIPLSRLVLDWCYFNVGLTSIILSQLWNNVDQRLGCIIIPYLIKSGSTSVVTLRSYKKIAPFMTWAHLIVKVSLSSWFTEMCNILIKWFNLIKTGCGDFKALLSGYTRLTHRVSDVFIAPNILHNQVFCILLSCKS